MAFFDIMKRMVEGRPAFEDETAAKAVTQPVQTETPGVQSTGPIIRKGDDSSFPVVFIKHTTTRFDSKNMEVYCQIKNTWPEEIMLDKIHLGDAMRELDDYLRGNEEREFLVYRGPRLQKQLYEAQLDYKTREEGDYFQAIHDVKCAYHEDDKRYSIDEMRIRQPVRDIYG